MSSAELSAVVIRRFEGLRLNPYLDSIGVPTIGIGATYYQNGLRVTLQDSPITKEAANNLLAWMIRTVYLPRVLELCPTLDTDNRIAAITSFAFNLGVKSLEHSTLRKKILAKNWSAVPDELEKWNKAGGVVNTGLTKRRAAEAALFG
jgi:lysozyme